MDRSDVDALVAVAVHGDDAARAALADWLGEYGRERGDDTLAAALADRGQAAAALLMVQAIAATYNTAPSLAVLRFHWHARHVKAAVKAAATNRRLMDPPALPAVPPLPAPERINPKLWFGYADPLTPLLPPRAAATAGEPGTAAFRPLIAAATRTFGKPGGVVVTLVVLVVTAAVLTVVVACGFVRLGWRAACGGRGV